MAPKKQPRNSFYYFMKELQEKEALKGRTVPMSSLSNLASPLWNKMSAVEKAPYNEMAKRYKNDPTLRGGKMASDGTRVEDNLREIRDQEIQQNMMKAEIKRYLNVECISTEEFKVFASRKILYFISFNIMCHTETEYIPIEIGIVEYSVLNGIHREFHRILYPGRIPTGYAGDAKMLSQEKHEIEVFSAEVDSERDMFKVFNDILRFINPEDHDEFPPLFCLEQDIEQNSGCLQWLASRARERYEFDVWNATYLLLELRAGTQHPLPSLTLANDLLTKTSFNYHPAARCDFHEEKDNYNCALAYSKRLCYLMSDAVCNQFEVILTERHMPSQYQEECGYMVTVYNNPERNRQGYASPSVRLDQGRNYYQNEVDDEQFADAPVRSTPALVQEKPITPRQPATNCIAAEMARLNLQMTSATVPGLGIGRGQRRNN